MSMFRRPTDDSSDSESSSDQSETGDLDHSNADTDNSNAGTEELFGADLTTAGTLSSGESISVDHSRDEFAIADAEHVRHMMLASLLEDFYRTRAAERYNAANPGANVHRQSPEIQPLARMLFAQASQALSSNGLLPAAVISDERQNLRGQYLAGFDTFGLHNLKDSDLLAKPMVRRISASENQLALVRKAGPSQPAALDAANQSIRNLALRTEQLSVVPHPTNDMQLSFPNMPHSHYKASFQELRFLGRGGFGRVYQTYNVFDKREYAVKKIPLSVQLSQLYRQRGHAELTSVLREVQALAQLDHCNVVRYHATWIEDPVTPFRSQVSPNLTAPVVRQKLIANHPTFPSGFEARRRSSAKMFSVGAGEDGIRFEADSIGGVAGQTGALEWSHHSNFREKDSSMPDSDIFTDGLAQNVRQDRTIDDPSCYVLHVQMSMYPQTLAQYLSASPNTARHDPTTPMKRHCFHLIPALRILLGILCGLQYIHSRGLIHRDIKPSNIFLSNFEVQSYVHLPDGFYDVGKCPSCPSQHSYHVNPRIGDFGLVADAARKHTAGDGSGDSSSGAVGTEYYRPPIENGKRRAEMIDEKLDVYALGVIFVELLWCCGTSMERTKLLRDVQSGVVPQQIIKAVEIDEHCPDVGEMVEDCISGMIQRDHSERWTCSKTKDQLERILARCESVSQDIG